MRINKGKIIEFKEEEDPYNKGNFLDGSIDRRAYEKMIITNVNGERCYQEITTTPKFHYPTDKNGNFFFSTDINLIESFEKYDGTNILQYTYNDANNKTYVSYKTRLTMFPSEIYQMMFEKMLKKYPNINEMPFINNCNLSYELYGYLNHHIIVYDDSLELALLFGIKNSGELISPSFLNSPEISKADLNKKFNFKDIDDLIKNYNEERQFLETKLVPMGEPVPFIDDYGIPIRDKDGNPIETYMEFKGFEGSMWYCHLPHYTQLYKLKPPTIELIHQSQSAGGAKMSKIAIKNTLINALEDLYELSLEEVMPYLLEEYSQDEINLSQKFIREQIVILNEQKNFEREVIKYYKESGLDINKDKGETMRYMSSIFSRNKKKITRVFNVLNKYFIE